LRWDQETKILSTYRPHRVFHIGLSQKALHTKVKHLVVMQYHMLDLLTDEMQLVFSANPTGLPQIKYHILFQLIQKHFGICRDANTFLPAVQKPRTQQ